MSEAIPAPDPSDASSGELINPDALRLRSIPSESLLQGQQEVLITHGPELYRLRLTRNGKLILQK